MIIILTILTVLTVLNTALTIYNSKVIKDYIISSHTADTTNFNTVLQNQLLLEKRLKTVEQPTLSFLKAIQNMAENKVMSPFNINDFKNNSNENKE